ncbi:hypothetical protein [Amycolatopsis rubida]|uniref:Uncharacterized protein n=1 Tax=Amycolatopsis rubida TaxID=112413 RepID=A0A1I5EPE9_9PSEU|nr:hypothetical protein [Amycolatopsis rubida]SFO13233.1 hypothetical protein SAMN05421854_101735 [Amycolatopsis rubida]
MRAFAAACWLLVTAKPRTHPSFQFGLMLIAAAAISGVMLLRGRTGDRFFRSADAKFSTTLRQGSLPNSYPNRPQVSGATMAIVLVAAAAVASGVRAAVLRRAAGEP